MLIALNVGVFLMWQSGSREHLEFMLDNFSVSWELLADGRYWTLLTSVFSHNMLWHLLINMLVLLSFGSLLEQVLGRGRFIRFYLVAGLVASFSHSLLSYLLLHSPETPAVGASGAIAGLVLLFALMFPKEKLLIFGISPLPAMLGAVAFVGLDLWGLAAQAGGGGLPIGHGAHLGGSFVGVIYYFFFIRKRWRRLGRGM
jgi:membrane associated rhomboid family serine protease